MKLPPRLANLRTPTPAQRRDALSIVARTNSPERAARLLGVGSKQTLLRICRGDRVHAFTLERFTSRFAAALKEADVANAAWLAKITGVPCTEANDLYGTASPYDGPLVELVFERDGDDGGWQIASSEVIRLAGWEESTLSDEVWILSECNDGPPLTEEEWARLEKGERVKVRCGFSYTRRLDRED